ncbi:MAG: [protein-PII] uridylyltransferase [Desulfobacterales bacterium]
MFRTRDQELSNAIRMLSNRRRHLAEDFLSGKEDNFLLLHTRIMDDYFCHAFEHSIVGPRIGISKNPYAIVALGGYGREEQCIHSDIDLLLLFKDRVPDTAEDLVREVVYPLWDQGLEIGHATRSLRECVKMAAKDYDILTPLLDARFICGISPLYMELMKQVREKILKKNAEKITSWLIEKNRDRHERFGDSSFLLEPNLKEGRGGLRDYHTLLWIAKINKHIKQRRDLEFAGILSHDEYESLTEALSFIWSIRNRLHHMTGRKCDRLHFEYQIRMAEAMKYEEKNGLLPVNRFLGCLHEQMEFLKQLHLTFVYEMEIDTRKFGKKRVATNTKIEGLNIKKGMLFFNTPEDIFNNRNLLIHIFEESARLKVPLGTEARRLVREFVHLMDENFIRSESAVKSFERILVEPSPRFKVLDEMLHTGFLTRFIPEFESIFHRIQYDEYHLYPVDKHMLRTVETIKKFGTSEDPTKHPLCGEIYNDLKDRKILLWAALLHDIGKGMPEHGHSERGELIARNIMIAKGYAPEIAETVGYIVKEHLLLAKTAMRRDINDEETSINCARKVQDPERLKMLYLLTIADSISTGPKAWNDWTATLLRSLFLKVMGILKRGELASSEALEIVEKKRTMVKDLAGSAKELSELETLFNFMSPRYLLWAPSEEMYNHIKLFHRRGDKPFVWDILQSPDTDTRTVTICAQDAPGLISKIAGVFTLNGINILDVQVFTWRNNVALDIFKVQPPPDQMFENERWARAAEHLNDAIAGKLDLKEALKEKLSSYRVSGLTGSGRKSRVEVDNESSSFFTIIEVFTDDFPGLLHCITDALFSCKLDIWVAKIATKVDQVVDAFYVRDFDGQKVDTPEQEAMIKKTILSALANIENNGRLKG